MTHQQRSNKKLAGRARYLYIGLPAGAMALFLILGSYLSHSLANDFAQQLAWKYAFEAASNFQIATNPHFLLMNQVSYSTTISRWMNDPYNNELRELAFYEMYGFAKNSPETQRMMFTVYESLTAYDFFVNNEKVTVDTFDITYNMSEGGEAQWFYHTRTAETPFIVNIQRQRADLLDEEIALFLWLNHRIYYDGAFVGTVTIGFPFDYAYEAIFANYDIAYIRGFLIDEEGLVRIDSAALLELHSEGFPTPKPLPEAIYNPNLAEHIQEHLTLRQNGVFQSHHLNDEVIPLSVGRYSYASISPILGTSWSVVVLSNYDEFLAGRYIPLFTITFFILFLSILAGSLMVKQGIISPLLKLTQGAAKAADLTQKPQISGLERDDELGDLARTIHFMRENLEESVQEAQAANRSKSDFLSTISHEIRTPMNTIIGMSSIGRLATELNRKDYAFDQINVASKYLLGIINDVLDMSKIEVGSLALTEQPFNLLTTFNNVWTVNQFIIEEKKQRLDIQIDERIPEVLIGDEQRLAQVLINLVSNAVKFTPRGKNIKMKASLVSLTDLICLLELSVVDEGIGIPANQQEQIFNPFVQADSSTSRKYGGTGLGLSISKQLVEMMGGSIWVQSTYGKGANFTFQIPLSLGGFFIEEPPNRCDAADYSAYTLLLVDDVELNREIVIALLEQTGINIVCAKNGAEAVEMFKEAPEKFDVIFMDVHMPIMDGFEATSHIRAWEATRTGNVPIVAITANAFQQDVEKCIQRGMTAHLGKPLILESIMKVLERYLNK